MKVKKLGLYFQSKIWQTPSVLLLLMAGAMAISLNGWMALLNNFAVERIGFEGDDIGFLQGVREIPGFLSFGVVFLIFFMREQLLALLFLSLLGIATALTGFFPALLPIYLLTLFSSIGFHFFEALHQSLTLQQIPKKEAPQFMGRQISVMAVATVLVYIIIILGSRPDYVPDMARFVGFQTDWQPTGLDYKWVYLIAGIITVFLAVIAYFAFPIFKAEHIQNKHLFLRKRYWLYYALVFLSGARRQIFVVFAPFMMVQIFGFNIAEVTFLFLVNYIVNIKLAPIIGRLIARWGERKALIFEYTGLILVFTGYALVNDATWAAALYVIDHFFFAFAIAIKTYFQKIADPKDIASTMGVSFSINHIAAVAMPPLLGLVWLVSPPAVFLCGAMIAVGSLILSFLVPRHPMEGAETLWKTPATLFGQKAT